eukprot:Lithocolla_globosa_v1_NODE_1630_length_2435_cov_3.831513.p2 type:complete len:135 gc:universal NODE_1630_length_2435_cov_3.831513:2115-1711(-)
MIVSRGCSLDDYLVLPVETSRIFAFLPHPIKSCLHQIFGHLGRFLPNKENLCFAHSFLDAETAPSSFLSFLCSWFCFSYFLYLSSLFFPSLSFLFFDLNNTSKKIHIYEEMVVTVRETNIGFYHHWDSWCGLPI